MRPLRQHTTPSRELVKRSARFNLIVPNSQALKDLVLKDTVLKNLVMKSILLAVLIFDFTVQTAQAETETRAPAPPAANQPTLSQPAANQAAREKPASASLLIKSVLDPEKYFGKAKLGYMAARLCPEICEKLFCYCGCDVTDEHSTLLDCFTSDHGVDCYICQEEALIALKMKREGKSLAEIQKVIDLQYEKQNPFAPTDKLLRYQKERLWQPDKTSNPGKTKGKQSEKLAGQTTTNANSAKSKSDLPSASNRGDTDMLPSGNSQSKKQSQSNSRSSTGPGCCSGKKKVK